MIVVRFSLLLLLCTVVWTTSASQQQQQQTNNSKNLPAFQFPEFPKQEKPIMRAWFCDGLTQRNLVDNLRQANIVKSAAVQATMEVVDRQFYVPDKRNPYADSPQAILKSQTISAPHMHAYALEEVLPHLLQRQKEILQSGDTSQAIKILDVGCGSGFLTACFGRWFKPPVGTAAVDQDPPTFTVKGKVFGMDIHNELVSLTRKNMEKADKDLLDDGIVQLRVGNGWKGWPEEAPFDAIHVGAAAASVPMDLVQQLLAPHGVLIVPVGAQNSVQKLLKIQRQVESPEFSPDDFSVHELLQVRYVPLVQRPENLRP